MHRLVYHYSVTCLFGYLSILVQTINILTHFRAIIIRLAAVNNLGLELWFYASISLSWFNGYLEYLNSDNWHSSQIFRPCQNMKMITKTKHSNILSSWEAYQLRVKTSKVETIYNKVVINYMDPQSTWTVCSFVLECASNRWRVKPSVHFFLWRFSNIFSSSSFFR